MNPNSFAYRVLKAQDDCFDEDFHEINLSRFYLFDEKKKPLDLSHARKEQLEVQMLEMFKTAYPTICEIFNSELANSPSDYYPMIKADQFTEIVHKLELLPQDWSVK